MTYDELCDTAIRLKWKLELGVRKSDLPGRSDLWWVRVETAKFTVMQGARGQLTKVLPGITRQVVMQIDAKA